MTNCETRNAWLIYYTHASQTWGHSQQQAQYYKSYHSLNRTRKPTEQSG